MINIKTAIFTALRHPLATNETALITAAVADIRKSTPVARRKRYALIHLRRGAAIKRGTAHHTGAIEAGHLRLPTFWRDLGQGDGERTVMSRSLWAPRPPRDWESWAVAADRVR